MSTYYAVIKISTPGDLAPTLAQMRTATDSATAAAVRGQVYEGQIDSSAMPSGWAGAYLIAAAGPGGGPPDPTITP